jgi:integral membrane sensor domain MASE1
LVQFTVIPVALALLYVAGARLGLQLAYVTPTATAVWPPTAIALAALLVFGTRLWPVIFVGAMLVNLYTVESVASVLVIAAGNTLEAVVGAALVRRFARGLEAFDRAADAFRFAGLTALVATPISATIGVFALWMADHSGRGLGNVWLTWWLGGRQRRL